MPASPRDEPRKRPGRRAASGQAARAAFLVSFADHPRLGPVSSCTVEGPELSRRPAALSAEAMIEALPEALRLARLSAAGDHVGIDPAGYDDWDAGNAAFMARNSEIARQLKPVGAALVGASLGLPKTARRGLYLVEGLDWNQHPWSGRVRAFTSEEAKFQAAWAMAHAAEDRPGNDDDLVASMSRSVVTSCDFRSRTARPSDAPAPRPQPTKGPSR